MKRLSHFLLFLCVSARPGFTAETTRPNFLFITIDDMNDWVSCLSGHLDTEHRPAG